MRKSANGRNRINAVCISALLVFAGAVSIQAQSEKASGRVEKVAGQDIHVRYQSVDRPFSMGDTLFVKIGEEYVKVTVTYPMFTIAKCRLEPSAARYLKQIGKGMGVYYHKAPEREIVIVPETPATPAVPEEKSRFKKADGIVADMQTGLMWAQNNGLFRGKLDDAKKFSSEIELGNFRDWRVPTKRELESLLSGVQKDEEYDYYLEAAGFVNAKYTYWTSSLYNHRNVWVISGGKNYFSGADIEDNLSLLAVRGDSGKLDDFTGIIRDNGNGTMTDTATGLVWMKKADAAGGESTWNSASESVKKLTGFAGQAGWRIPTKPEIDSLVAKFPWREQLRPKLLTGLGFTDIGRTYWTSSAPGEDAAARIYMNFQYDTFDTSKTAGTQKHSVWLVSGNRTDLKPTGESFFVSKTENTVTDTRSGLTWSKRAYLSGGEWDDVVSNAEKVTLDGFDGWRTANYDDMKSLLASAPTDQDPRMYLSLQGFYNFQKEYWLSSEYISNSDSAWCINLGASKFGCSLQDQKRPGWLVRGGSAKKKNVVSPFAVQGDESMIDLRSNLMWLKNANLPGKELTHQEALAFCAKLNAGGFTDWRLPTDGELEKMIEGQKPYKDSRKAFAKNGFANVQSKYWSSTRSTVIKDAVYYDVVSFEETASGRCAGDRPDSVCGVWPVRSAK